MVKRKCSKCGKVYEQNKSEKFRRWAGAVGGDEDVSLCYDCALQKVTNGTPPEEGDFNSARLISGEMSDQELEWLLQDLRGESDGGCGRSMSHAYDPDEDEDACEEQSRRELDDDWYKRQREEE